MRENVVRNESNGRGSRNGLTSRFWLSLWGWLLGAKAVCSVTNSKREVFGISESLENFTVGVSNGESAGGICVILGGIPT